MDDIVVALDLNGGDLAPTEVIEGIRIAVNRGYILPKQILAFGDHQAITALKRIKDPGFRRINYRLCYDVVNMGDKLSDITKKRDSSISQGIASVKSKEADVFVSAGNTAAMVGLSVGILGRKKRSILPAIAVILPSKNGHCLVIDVGANANATENDLLNNAKMGSAYAEKILGLSSPRVGLLNIGEEIDKGHKDIHKAYGLIASSGLNFIGYVEGNDIFKGTVDVAVTDGFTGNIILKSSEGLAKMILDLVRMELKNNKLFYLALPFLICAMPFLYPILKSLKIKLDYDEYGGALLLGVQGNIIIAHGHSKRRTIAKAIKAAVREVELGVKDLVLNELLDHKKTPEA